MKFLFLHKFTFELKHLKFNAKLFAVLIAALLSVLFFISLVIQVVEFFNVSGDRDGGL